MKKFVKFIVLGMGLLLVAGCTVKEKEEMLESSNQFIPSKKNVKLKLENIFEAGEPIEVVVSEYYGEADKIKYIQIPKEEGIITSVYYESGQELDTDYSIKKVEDGLYRYSFKNNVGIHTGDKNSFRGKEYNVFEIDNNIFGVVDLIPNGANENSTLEETKQLFEERNGWVWSLALDRTKPQ